MSQLDKAARVAGAWYLSLILSAPFGLLYIPKTLTVSGDAAATAARVLAHEALFRLGVVADMAASLTLLFLALALYRLLSGVNQFRAVQMVALAAVSAAIGFLNALYSVAALLLFRGGGYLAVVDKAQLEAFGMFFLGLHRQGLAINQVLWGLWLFPFGLLVIRSRFLPRMLGALLIVNCFAYVAVSLTSLLAPSFTAFVSKTTFPALLGELWILLWLLIKGAGGYRSDGLPA